MQRPSRRRASGDRLKVAVLMGGPSGEHEVSLSGGRCVARALDPALFEMRPVVIQRDGVWRMLPRGVRSGARSRHAQAGASRTGSTRSTGTRPTGTRSTGTRSTGRRLGKATDTELPGGGLGQGAELAFDPHDADRWPEIGPVWDGIRELRAWGVDVVLPVIHGRFGEDGVLQACLEAAGIPFVGSGQRASALAFDKVRAKEIFLAHGIPTPDYAVVRTQSLKRQRAAQAETWVERFGLPLVLKNPVGGSSIEVRIPRSAQEVVPALDELIPGSNRILVERFVPGRELTAGVVEVRGEEQPIALPIVEIRPRSAHLFDYREKYSADGAEELCPAPLDPELTAAAQSLGRRVHEALGLRGLSRTDLRLDEGGELSVLEVNTIPGMSERGLVPLAAGVAGLALGDLMGHLVRAAAAGEGL